MSTTQLTPELANTTRLEKLNSAALLYNFHKKLDRSAWESIGWGIFSLGIALFVFSRGGLAWVHLVFGILLIAEGIYEKQVREPKVIKVEAATLGLTGLWNIGVFALGIATRIRVIGISPVVPIFQLVRAWQTYKSYALYATLTASVAPATNAEFKTMLDQLKNAVPADTPDVVEFTSSRFLKNDIRWRVRRMDGYFFLMGKETGLGKKPQLTCMFLERGAVKLEILGEKMFGSKQKVVVIAGDQKLKGTMAAEMAQRMMLLC
jgi:hypothetical protein